MEILITSLSVYIFTVLTMIVCFYMFQDDYPKKSMWEITKETQVYAYIPVLNTTLLLLFFIIFIYSYFKK